MAARRQYPDAADPRIVSAARSAIAEARASGTGLLGDISNTLVTAPLLREASLPAQIFYELLRFNASEAESMTREARAKADAAAHPDRDVRVSLSPHAPYSVSPALFRAIRDDLDAHPGQVTSVHLGESPEEIEFIRRGTGPWRVLLEELGRLDRCLGADWDVSGGLPRTARISRLHGCWPCTVSSSMATTWIVCGRAT